MMSNMNTKKIIQKLELEVTSEIVSIENLANGSRAVRVKSSGPSHTQENVMTVAPNPACPEEQFESDLEAFRDRMAEEVAKAELGIAPQPREYWHVVVANPEKPEQRALGIASWDPRLERTLVWKEFCDLLELPPGRDPSLRSAVLQVIGKKFIVDVKPANISIPCVVGRDLFMLAISDSATPSPSLADLFLDGTARAYQAQKRAKAKTVLIIGSYKKGIARLRQIEVSLVQLGYEPVLLADYPEGTESLEAKMASFVMLSAFVIYEGSFPSGAIDELHICKDMRAVTAILQEKGRAATLMQQDYAVDLTFMRFFEYDPEQLDQTVRQATAWAEQTGTERKRAYEAAHQRDR